MKECFVFIYPPGEVKAIPAGRLSLGNASATFAYGKRYLSNPVRIPVDPILLPFGQPGHTALLDPDRLGAIRDAAPDYWGRHVIEYTRGQEALHEIEYLMEENSCRVGNLDFRQELSSPEAAIGPPIRNDLESLMRLADRIERNQPLDKIPQKLIRLLQHGSSIGGARPKVTVCDESGMWIAKFPSRHDTWSNARIEGATMHLASMCGILIPDIKVETIARKEIFFIRRFDREKAEQGWTRQGYMSALSLLGLNEYERGKFSYLELADRMRQHQASGEELFRRMIFNILCRNTDDHPRNHGYLIKDGRLILAPAFDITPTASRSGVSTTTDLAMIIGMNGRSADMENALSACSRFALTREDAENIISSMTEIFLGEWERLFDYYGVCLREKEFFSYTFERWRTIGNGSDQNHIKGYGSTPS
jgi:serine/threonine-protein kinase HipA